MQDGIDSLRHDHDHAQLNALRTWISQTDSVAQQLDTFRRRCAGTSQWFLEAPEFAKWLNRSSPDKTLFCTGMPGAGKTVLAAIVIDHLSRKVRCNTVGVAWLYCSYKSQREQTVEFKLATVLQQLVQVETPGTVKHAQKLMQEHKQSMTRPTEDQYRETLQAVLSEFKTIYVVVDALDEFNEGTRHRIITHL